MFLSFFNSLLNQWQACDLVNRFDPLQHMVGYLQSRGRARHRSSKFIIMVQEGHLTHAARYKAFSESEPQLRLVYQSRDIRETSPEPGEIEEEEERDDGRVVAAVRDEAELAQAAVQVARVEREPAQAHLPVRAVDHALRERHPAGERGRGCGAGDDFGLGDDRGGLWGTEESE